MPKWKVTKLPPEEDVFSDMLFLKPDPRYTVEVVESENPKAVPFTVEIFVNEIWAGSFREQLGKWTGSYCFGGHVSGCTQFTRSDDLLITALVKVSCCIRKKQGTLEVVQIE